MSEQYTHLQSNYNYGFPSVKLLLEGERVFCWPRGSFIVQNDSPVQIVLMAPKVTTPCNAGIAGGAASASTVFANATIIYAEVRGESFTRERFSCQSQSPSPLYPATAVRGEQLARNNSSNVGVDKCHTQLPGRAASLPCGPDKSFLSCLRTR